MAGYQRLEANPTVVHATRGAVAASSMMLLASVYYGAQYGGSTAAILMNTPGATSAEVTACGTS